MQIVFIFQNIFNLFVQTGVAHADDVGYLFYSNIFKNLPEPDSSAEKVINIMTKMWTNFAKDGLVMLFFISNILNLTVR